MPTSSSARPRTLLTASLLVAAFAALFAAVWLSPPHHALEGLAGYLPLHNFLEGASIVVAMLVFGITWNAYTRERPGSMVILACGLLAVGLIDFGHMLSFKGMPDFVTPASPEKAIDFWLAARLVFAACLAAAAARPAAPLAAPWTRHALLGAAVAVAAFVYWLVLARERDLPRTFIEGQGLTAAKIAAEYFVVGLLAVPAVVFYARARRSRSAEPALLFAAASVSILGELSFTLYSAVTDVFNLLGHVYKIVAYGFIYRSIFVANVREPFERLLSAKKFVEGSERYFRKLIEGGADIFLVLDERGIVRYRSDSGIRLTGWDAGEVIGQRIGRFVQPADAHLVEEALAAVRRAPGAQANVEVGVRRKDGSTLGLEVNVKNLLADPDIGGIIVTAHDVTERRKADVALRESEERYRSIFERAKDVLYIIGPDATFVSLSPAFSLATGWEPSEWIGRRFEPIVHPEERARAREILDRTLAERVSSHFEMRIASKSGKYWDGDFSVGPLTLGGATYLFGIGRDVSDRKAQQRRIERLTRVHTVLSGINAAIVRIQDRRLLFEEACRIAIEAGGFRMAWIGVVDEQAMAVKPVAWGGEVHGFLDSAPLALVETRPEGQGLVGRAVRGLAPVISNDIENDPQRLMKKECAERGIHSLAVLPLIVAGKAVGVLCLYAAETGFFDDEEMRLLGDLAGDISFALDHIAKKEEVNYLAYYDVLTGLPNRAFFGESLDQHLQKVAGGGGAVAVVVGDIERFRNVNETFGRPAADRMLCDIAQRLKQCAGAGVRVARIEADRFALALPEVRDAAQAVHALEAIVGECFGRPFGIDGHELLLSMRLGIALFPTDGADADTLYRNAEIALVKAKDATERYLFYAPEMNARVAETVALENKLRRAVEQRQFVLHYQPKVNARTGRLSGLEALIRWNDPETGLVPPARFIPILEETGLILPVGEWALREAIAQHARWRGLGLQPPRIAVNVSAAQLRRRDFVETVKSALASQAGGEHGLDLEVTESLIMANAEENVEKLRRLRAMGVHIAIDDFGTGYSSLRYIGQFPIDALKIDRSFIVRMAGNSGDMSIVSTIIALGHDLQLTVVGEGVESEEQAKLLRLLKCDEMQGFLFSEPLPAAEMERLMRRQAAAAVPVPVAAGGIPG